MLRVIVFLIALTLTACGGGSGMNFNDGTWSMCTFKSKDGVVVSIPLQTSLPVGAEHPNGIVIKCEPIPAKE